MAQTPKILWQSNPAANTLTTVYTTPSGTAAVVSSIVVCHRANTAETWTLKVAPGGAVDDVAHAQFQDEEEPEGGGTFVATLGLTLGADDEVRVEVSAQEFSITGYGMEVDL